ncbi:MAG: TRL domain-containing protein [Burkholderiaceae bacterium]
MSCSQNYLGAATLGDASVEAAKQSAGISTVTTVDRYYHRILTFYGQLCTVVTGH